MKIRSAYTKRLSKEIYEKFELKGYELTVNSKGFKAFLEKGIRVSKKVTKTGIEYSVYDAVASTDYYEINNTFLLKLILENI